MLNLVTALMWVPSPQTWLLAQVGQTIGGLDWRQFPNPVPASSPAHFPGASYFFLSSASTFFP